MQLDQNSPLIARQEIDIDARPDQVWALLTDIPRWPAWQPDIESATLEGGLAPGSVFRWKAKGLSITSVIRELQQEALIGWTGDSPGMRAVHRWLFTATDGGVRVATEESLSGWLAHVIRLFDPHFLEKSLANSLQLLKSSAEQRKGGSNE